jgi:hypothetical protein
MVNQVVFPSSQSRVKPAVRFLKRITERESQELHQSVCPNTGDNRFQLESNTVISESFGSLKELSEKGPDLEGSLGSVIRGFTK